MPVFSYSKFCIRLDALLSQIQKGEYQPQKILFYDNMTLLAILEEDELIKATRQPIGKDKPDYVASVKLTNKGEEFISHGGYSNFSD